MPELILKQDLLAPAAAKYLEFSVFHPSRLVKQMPEIIKDVLRVEGGDVFEPQIKWDRSGENINFFGIWKGRYTEDVRSAIWITIKIQGSQSKKDKMGTVKIWLTGSLDTVFSYSSLLGKGFVWFYNYVFYSKQRSKYMGDGKVLLQRLEDEMKSLLNLMKR